LVLAAVVTLTFALPVQVAAIDIVMNYNSSASDNPSDDSNASKLISLMSAAETYYEDIFTASGTLNVEFYYYEFDNSSTLGRHNNLTTSGGKPTSCRIRLDNDRWWFYDDTPFENSEYDISQTLVKDMSSPDNYYNGTVPDYLEYSYKGSSNGSEGFWHQFEHDMWSVILHEMGHALGMTANVAGTEASDNEYDFHPDLVWGNNTKAEVYASDNRYHLEANTMMNPTISMGKRVLPSATDIFAIETAANWGDETIRLKRVEFYSADANADMNEGTNWAGNLWPDYDQDTWIRDGGTATLTWHNIGTNYLYIGNDTTVSTSSYRLRSDRSTTLGDSDGYGKVIINNGGEFQVDWTLTVKNGSEIEMQSGSLLDADTLKLNIGADIIGAGTIDIEDSFINEGTITTSGGTLTINSLVNVNLDGASPNDGAGSVLVTGGNFVCNRALTDNFSGLVRVNSGYTATFTNGWRNIGSLDLNGGTSSSTRAKIGGGLFKCAASVDVDKQCELTCDTEFQATTVTLANSDDNLYVASGATATITDDAEFNGAGRLYGLAGSTIVMDDGSEIDIRFRVHGGFTVEEDGIGTATADYAIAFASTSDVIMEASGDGVCDLLDTNIATTYLDGVLTLDLINGYTPDVGDSFTVITYEIRSGTFDSIVCSDPSVSLTASYSSTALTLLVTAVDSVTAVPEPSTIALLLSALTVLGTVAIRKRGNR
jgi:hypothetical protein